MENVLLIIGNGFDLNLDMATSYTNFINSIRIKEDNDLLGVKSKNNESNSNEFEEDFSFEGNYHIDKNTGIIKVKKSYLLLELITIQKIENWVDIEMELGNLAKNYLKRAPKLFIKKDSVDVAPRDLLRDEYNELKTLLKDYIEVQNNKISKDLFVDITNKMEIKKKYEKYCKFKSFKVLEELQNNQNINLTILNFNYSHSIINCLSLINKYNSLKGIVLKTRNIPAKDKITIPKNHIFVHGHLQEDIVFGIDDKEELERDYLYLHKSFNHITTNINVNNLLNDSKKVIFFGCSMGKTDESYFDDFFKKVCKYNELKKEKQKEIIFYHYQERGYFELFERLIDLTNHNTSKLRQYNNVKFIDSDNSVD